VEVGVRRVSPEVLLSGLFGALLVFLLGVLREWWRNEQERRGLLILLLTEISHNGEVIRTVQDRINPDQAMEDLIGHPHFSTQKVRTWDNVQERAAALLPDYLMAALDEYYAPLETLLTLVHFPNMASDSFDRTLRRVMCNELDQQVRQVAQRSAEGVVDLLCAGVGRDLGR
jgi:hypothetical protein